MSEIDYALGLDFIDPAEGVPRQLRFDRDWAPNDDPRVFTGTGQLIAVVKGARAESGNTVAISRPNVGFDDVEAALEGWRTWAKSTTGRVVDLNAIRQRINDAGLGVN
ncbi:MULTISPECIES: hypothetical protein [Mycolicibacter]|uniref:Uncharacterized protein n=2 Tax=Mycolicibacter TaxID=1073531 RepID=A0ABU5XPX2_9MYCO|nr:MULTISPECIES: hypothetical protein [unclassified Mycolicibacter]MEB3023372.1 hypothetical protein [Mycolicibacter sp. MYC098]MEB3033714.1 hypothetical protein [Mycolicibacter sp. MYC340]